MKKWVILIISAAIVTVFSSYNYSANIANQPSTIATPENSSPLAAATQSPAAKESYIVNDAIPIGSKDNIILKSGKFTDSIYNGKEENLLGLDADGNIIKFNYNTNCIESVDASGTSTTLVDIMGSRKNYVYQIEKSGNRVAWSECPYGADPSMDKTNGADWQLFYVDLKTKKITKVDAYKDGLCVPEKSQDGYLCPDQVHINQNYISYVTFDYNSMGSVTNVVKLYDIESKNLKVIDYLNDDLVTHYFTCSAAENGRLAWSREQLNPDGTYISTTYLYDIKTARKAKVETDKNIGFPVLVGNFLCVQNNPNKTFYDSEVCIYDINTSAWVYKINNGLAQYKNYKDVYLTQLETDGTYLLWSSGINYGLTVFNGQDKKLYALVPVPDKSSVNEISYPRLLDGGLFVWESIKYGDSSHPDSYCTNYCVLAH